MFKPNTVFVVGAGASAEVELPTGEGLAEKIKELLDGLIAQSSQPHTYSPIKGGSAKIRRAIETHCKNIGGSDVFIVAAKKISGGITLVDSIDNFLDMHAADKVVVFCGKLAIARAILDAEKVSTLYPSQGTISPTVAKTWFKPFFSKLVIDRKQPNRKSVFDGVTIICFNYDRCIEHYLIHALQDTYAIPSEEAADLVSKLKIYRPYGTVGKLKTPINSEGLAFGAELEGISLVDAANNIRTYTEQSGDPELLSDVKQAIADAKTIVFLGFAYGEQNIEILRPDELGKVERMFGTTYEMSGYNADQGKRRARKLSKERGIYCKTHFKNITCHDLIKDFGLGL